jgi:hypothetical protein
MLLVNACQNLQNLLQIVSLAACSIIIEQDGVRFGVNELPQQNPTMICCKN